MGMRAQRVDLNAQACEFITDAMRRMGVEALVHQGRSCDEAAQGAPAYLFGDAGTTVQAGEGQYAPTLAEGQESALRLRGAGPASTEVERWLQEAAAAPARRPVLGDSLVEIDASDTMVAPALEGRRGGRLWRR